MKEKLIIIVHWIIALLANTCFLWLDLKWILIGIFLYWMEMLIFGSCVLSIAQYDNKETTFLGTYMNKLFKILGIKELTIKQQHIFLRYILPFLILLLAILFQVVLKWQPLL